MHYIITKISAFMEIIGKIQVPSKRETVPQDGCGRHVNSISFLRFMPF